MNFSTKKLTILDNSWSFIFGCHKERKCRIHKNKKACTQTLYRKKKKESGIKKLFLNETISF